MLTCSNICFTITRDRTQYRRVDPEIDGVSLTEMATTFEVSQGFDTAGGYSGLVIEYTGDLQRYFLGELRTKARRTIALLGCDACCENGCWPLLCHLWVTQEKVYWKQFSQPHRFERDYSRFGPFIFDGRQYRQALKDLSAAYSALGVEPPQQIS